MGEQRFDVHIIGEPSIEVLKDKLGIPREQAAGLVERQVAAQGVSREAAERLCDWLRQHDVACKITPVVEDLELVSVEEGTPRFTCPACGHAQENAGDVPPRQCERCGVVPDKWERVQQQKLERARARRALLQRKEQERQRLEEQRALEERQRLREELEKELRRRLGIPRFAMRSRAALRGSVFALLLIGGGLGVFGTVLYQSLGSTPATEPFQAEAEPNPALGLAALDSSDPHRLASLLQSMKLIRRPHDGSSFYERNYVMADAHGGSANGGTEPTGDHGASWQRSGGSSLGRDGTGAFPAAGTAAPAQGVEIDIADPSQDVAYDVEWATFVTHRATTLAKQQEYDRAWQVAMSAPSWTDRIDAVSPVLEIAAQRGAVDQVAPSLEHLIREIRALPTAAQISPLAKAARVAYRLGLNALADSTLAHLDNLLLQIEEPLSRVHAAAALVTAYLERGAVDQASRTFGIVDQSVAALDRRRAILAQTEIAATYVATGRLGALFSALEAGIEWGQQHKDQEVLRNVARGFAEAGLLDRAVGVLSLLDDPLVADAEAERLLLRALRDDPVTVPSTFRDLRVARTPYGRARMALILAEVAKRNADTARMAHWLSQADEALETLAPSSAAYVLAHALQGRWLMRMGLSDRGQEAFREAVRALDPLAHDRPELVHVLAVEAARAGLVEQADDIAERYLPNGRLKDSTARENDAAAGVFSA